MNENWKRGMRISWYLLGPLLLYALVYDIVSFFWSREGNFMIPFAGYIPEYVPAGMMGVLALWFWIRKERVFYPKREKNRIPWIILVPAAAASCLFFNHLLVLLGIPSEGYDAVKDIIFHRERIWQIAGPGFFIPLAEEFAFRGLGYGRIRRELDVLPAAVITALLFGLYHGNMIQGIYAFLMGLLMALVCEAYGSLAASWLFHAVANLTAIFLTGTPIPVWFGDHRLAMILTAILGGTLLFGFVLKLREDLS